MLWLKYPIVVKMLLLLPQASIFAVILVKRVAEVPNGCTIILHSLNFRRKQRDAQNVHLMVGCCVLAQSSRLFTFTL